MLQIAQPNSRVCCNALCDRAIKNITYALVSRENVFYLCDKLNNRIMKYLDLIEFTAKCRKETIHSSIKWMTSLQREIAKQEYNRLDAIEHAAKILKMMGGK